MNRLKMTCAVLSLFGVVLAADMPFYKPGSGAPERRAAYSASSASAVPLDSRTVQSADSPATVFDADGRPGCLVVVR